MTANSSNLQIWPPAVLIVRRHLLSTGKDSKPPDAVDKCERMIKYIFGNANDKNAFTKPLNKDTVNKSIKKRDEKKDEPIPTPILTATANQNTILEQEKADLKERIAFDEKLQKPDDLGPFAKLPDDMTVHASSAKPKEEEPAQKVENLQEPSIVEPEKAEEAKLLSTAVKPQTKDEKKEPSETKPDIVTAGIRETPRSNSDTLRLMRCLISRHSIRIKRDKPSFTPKDEPERTESTSTLKAPSVKSPDILSVTKQIQTNVDANTDSKEQTVKEGLFITTKDKPSKSIDTTKEPSYLQQLMSTYDEIMSNNHPSKSKQFTNESTLAIKKEDTEYLSNLKKDEDSPAISQPTEQKSTATLYSMLTSSDNVGKGKDDKSKLSAEVTEHYSAPKTAEDSVPNLSAEPTEHYSTSKTPEDFVPETRAQKSDAKKTELAQESLKSALTNRLNEIGPMLPNYNLNVNSPSIHDDMDYPSNSEAHKASAPLLRIHELTNDVPPAQSGGSTTWANLWPRNQYQAQNPQQGYGSFPAVTASGIRGGSPDGGIPWCASQYQNNQQGSNPYTNQWYSNYANWQQMNNPPQYNATQNSTYGTGAWAKAYPQKYPTQQSQWSNNPYSRSQTANVVLPNQTQEQGQLPNKNQRWAGMFSYPFQSAPQNDPKMGKDNPKTEGNTKCSTPSNLQNDKMLSGIKPIIIDPKVMPSAFKPNTSTEQISADQSIKTNELIPTNDLSKLGIKIKPVQGIIVTEQTNELNEPIEAICLAPEKPEKLNELVEALTLASKALQRQQEETAKDIIKTAQIMTEPEQTEKQNEPLEALSLASKQIVKENEPADAVVLVSEQNVKQNEPGVILMSEPISKQKGPVDTLSLSSEALQINTEGGAVDTTKLLLDSQPGTTKTVLDTTKLLMNPNPDATKTTVLDTTKLIMNPQPDATKTTALDTTKLIMNPEPDTKKTTVLDTTNLIIKPKSDTKKPESVNSTPKEEVLKPIFEEMYVSINESEHPTNQPNPAVQNNTDIVRSSTPTHPEIQSNIPTIVGPLPNFPNDKDVPLSLLLKTIRLKNTIESYRDTLESFVTKPLKMTQCPPPPTCPPKKKKPKCPKPCPCPPPKCPPCPPPCPPPPPKCPPPCSPPKCPPPCPPPKPKCPKPPKCPCPCPPPPKPKCPPPCPPPKYPPCPPPCPPPKCPPPCPPPCPPCACITGVKHGEHLLKIDKTAQICQNLFAFPVYIQILENYCYRHFEYKYGKRKEIARVSQCSDHGILDILPQNILRNSTNR